MRTSFVGGVSQPRLCRQRGEVGRGQKGPPRLAPASGAFAGLFAFHHRPHVGERSATLTEIVVDGHRSLPTDRIPPGEARKPASHRRRARRHLSGDIGISTALMVCLVGPAGREMTPKSKMWVESHKVAQAFGMSTTPEMWP